MPEVVPLADAREDARFGAKATGLGAAARAGLPVPPGIALSGAIVEEVASGHPDAVAQVLDAARGLSTPLAVRSSAVDEDGALHGRAVDLESKAGPLDGRSEHARKLARERGQVDRLAGGAHAHVLAVNVPALSAATRSSMSLMSPSNSVAQRPMRLTMWLSLPPRPR